MTIYVIVGMIALIIVLYIVFGICQNRKMLKHFSSEYVNWDNMDNDFDRLKVIRKYWDEKDKNENIQYHIDDVTWNDLDMDYLYFKMNVCQSSIGEEYLYAKLREVKFDKNALDEFEKIIDFIDSHRSTKAKSLSLNNIALAKSNKSASKHK